jgi:hypothetical protein
MPDTFLCTDKWGFGPHKLIFGEADYLFFSEYPVLICALKYF